MTTLDDQIQSLETAVAKMESGELDLDAAITTYGDVLKQAKDIMAQLKKRHDQVRILNEQSEQLIDISESLMDQKASGQ